MFIVFVVFCKPVLAMLLQRRRLNSSMHVISRMFILCLSCFVIPSLQSYYKSFMLPKRRFWNAEPTFQNAFSKHFSTFASPNRVLFKENVIRSSMHSHMLVVFLKPILAILLKKTSDCSHASLFMNSS